jgi:REP element-mobilizing transposase RayT
VDLHSAGGPQLPSVRNCGVLGATLAPCPADSIASTTLALRISLPSPVITAIRISAVRDLFVRALERTRKPYRLHVYAFVAMPEHVHLLLSEPERGTVANAMQSLKLSSAKRGKQAHAVSNSATAFWQKRYYDRNVGGKEFTEKLKYIHRNPVKRKLWRNPRTENGAAIATTRAAKIGEYRSNRGETGRTASSSHNCQQKAIVGFERLHLAGWPGQAKPEAAPIKRSLSRGFRRTITHSFVSRITFNRDQLAWCFPPLPLHFLRKDEGELPSHESAAGQLPCPQ